MVLQLACFLKRSNCKQSEMKLQSIPAAKLVGAFSHPVFLIEAHTPPERKKQQMTCYSQKMVGWNIGVFLLRVFLIRGSKLHSWTRESFSYPWNTIRGHVFHDANNPNNARFCSEKSFINDKQHFSIKFDSYDLVMKNDPCPYRVGNFPNGFCGGTFNRWSKEYQMGPF